MAGMKTGLILRLVLVLAITAGGVAAKPPALPARLIAGAMGHWQVPGLALAVTKGGATMWMRGFGVRHVKTRRPVTPDTLFATGSITKSLTTTAMAMLAEQGRLDWDAPVMRILPPDIAGRASLRDLVTHRTGMARHDALWYLGAYDRAGLIARLRFLKPAAPLGETFAYNNLMFVAAGRLAAVAAGTQWETLVGRRILQPLGMAGARLALDGFRAAPDRAQGYFPGDDGRIAIPLRDTTAIAPAAALYASIRGLIGYVRFHLADGGKLMSRRAARAMRTEQISLGRAANFPELAPAGYGLGSYLTRYRGRRLVYHPGVIDGFAGLISFMPDQQIGMIVLSNLSGRNPVPAIVTYSLYDRLLGLEPVDWTARYLAAKPPRTGSKSAPLRSDGPPPRPLAAYAGKYRHPAYGVLEIRAGPDRQELAGALHGTRFRLVRRNGAWQVAETAWPLRRGLTMRFEFDGDGRPRRLVTPLADGPTYRLQAGNLVFTRDES
jgi:CubicO group peptidase (beta-lactamase class C family)